MICKDINDNYLFVTNKEEIIKDYENNPHYECITQLDKLHDKLNSKENEIIELKKKFNNLKNIYNNFITNIDNINSHNILLNNKIYKSIYENNIELLENTRNLQLQVNELINCKNNYTNIVNQLKKQNEDLIKYNDTLNEEIIKLKKNKDTKLTYSYTYNKILYFVKIRNQIEEENNIIDKNFDIIKYISYRVNHKYNNKYYLNRKIYRCLYLYDKYKDSLKYVYFSISYITNLNKCNWEDWKISFEKKMICDNFN
jgi:FtsZ-binding cell division protein ZapB